MPKSSLRTKSSKRRSIRLPGGRIETHFKREKIGVSHCARCGRTLSGIPRLIPSKLHKISSSQRMSQRMYGGQLCHVCLRSLLKDATRKI